MQKQSRGFTNGVMWQLAAMTVAGGIVLSGPICRADDTTKAQPTPEAQPTPTAQTDSPKKAATTSTQDTTKQSVSKTTGKNSKDVAAASPTPVAPKLDLTTPASKLNFYGSAEVGFESATLKGCNNKTTHATESYYQTTVGTDVKLTGDVTLGVEVSSAHGTTKFH